MVLTDRRMLCDPGHTVSLWATTALDWGVLLMILPHLVLHHLLIGYVKFPNSTILS